jgi:HK97 family phage major capsid protein
LIDLVYSVDAAYRRNAGGAQWMMRDATTAYIRKLKDGQQRYLWNPGSPSEGQPQTLEGYEVINGPASPAYGTAVKSILFGDWSSYAVLDFGQVTFVRSEERYLEEDSTAFRMVHRAGGTLWDLTGALKSFRGGSA